MQFQYLKKIDMSSLAPPAARASFIEAMDWAVKEVEAQAS